VAFGQPLVVAGAAAATGDPGQGALDHPSAGQDPGTHTSLLAGQGRYATLAA
jgi:hypothetical protein